MRDKSTTTTAEIYKSDTPLLKRLKRRIRKSNPDTKQADVIHDGLIMLNNVTKGK
jgi:hypothetical protein